MLEKMSDFFEARLEGYDVHMMTKIELAARYSHHNRIPLAVVRVPEHRRFKILVKRIVRRCVVDREAVFKEFLLFHYCFQLETAIKIFGQVC